MTSNELDDHIRRYGEELERAERRLAAQSSRSWLPRRRVAIAGAAVGLALGVAVAVLPGADDRSGTALAAAQRALSTDNAIVHSVSYTFTGKEPGASGDRRRRETWIGPGGTRTASDELEMAVSWDESGRERLARFVEYEPASNLYRDTERPIVAGYAPDDQELNVVRKLIDAGMVKDAGPAQLGEREARKFVSTRKVDEPTAAGGKSSVKVTIHSEYYVDPESFEPIRFLSSIDQGGDVRWFGVDFERFERLPLNDETRKLLTIDLPADAKRVSND